MRTSSTYITFFDIQHAYTIYQCTRRYIAINHGPINNFVSYTAATSKTDFEDVLILKRALAGRGKRKPWVQVGTALQYQRNRTNVLLRPSPQMCISSKHGQNASSVQMVIRYELQHHPRSGCFRKITRFTRGPSIDHYKISRRRLFILIYLKSV